MMIHYDSRVNRAIRPQRLPLAGSEADSSGVTRRRASLPAGDQMSLTLPTLRRTVVAAAAGLLLAACASAGGPASPATSAPAPPATSAPASSAAPAPGTPAPAPFAYQPLFPFASLAQVRAWQASFESGGHQPWHLSAEQTALAFTAFLGFTEVNKVAGRTGSNTDSHVAVGITLPNGKVSTAAIVHLVRYGTGADAPWEVVGTDDTTLTLDKPAYGATVTSPVTIGGRITGVDESLRAAVHMLGPVSTVGSYCCRPAGGQRSPWSFPVSFHAPAGTVLTIVVSTGGHVASVERFAVTGVRVR